MPPSSYQARPFAHVSEIYHPPKKNEDGDWIDPRDELMPGCTLNCTQWLTEYNNCVRRIEQRVDGKGHCQGQYEELAMCQDHCLSHHIFDHLK
jgi:ubiquinol-cytochrome c reductase subunit 6